MTVADFIHELVLTNCVGSNIFRKQETSMTSRNITLCGIVKVFRNSIEGCAGASEESLALIAIAEKYLRMARDFQFPHRFPLDNSMALERRIFMNVSEIKRGKAEKMSQEFRIS